MSLFEAICAWCDQKLVPEFRKLIEEGFDDDATGFLVGDGPERWKVSRYAEIREQLAHELRNKLQSQILTATGFDLRAPIGSPVTIPAELWPHLTINLRDSSATFDIIRFVAILVNIADDAVFGPPTLPRWVAPDDRD
jgi:hypothetical protein